MRIEYFRTTSNRFFPLRRFTALAVAALLLAPFRTSAQAAPASPEQAVVTAPSKVEEPVGDPFALGERVGFAGISLATHGTSGNFSLPPVQAGFDYAFHKYMTVGGVFQFSRHEYYRESLTYLTFAGRGTFHPTMWFKGMKVPLDPYGVATAGYTHAVWSGMGGAGYSFLVLGPSVGVRYWFTPNLSGQAETGLGNGLSLLSLGLAMRM